MHDSVSHHGSCFLVSWFLSSCPGRMGWIDSSTLLLRHLSVEVRHFFFFGE